MRSTGRCSGCGRGYEDAAAHHCFADDDYDPAIFTANGAARARRLSREQARLEREADLAALDDNIAAWGAGEARRRRLRAGIMLGLGLLSGLFVALALALSGCAHAPMPTRVVLGDRLGGLASQVLGMLTGQEPKAATLPGLPTIVFQPADADDPCLDAHERVHREDQWTMGGGRWTAEYLRQLGACERERSRGECLRTIELEARAYEAQHACQAGAR